MERLYQKRKKNWDIKIQSYNTILEKWIDRVTLQYYNDIETILQNMDFETREHRILINTFWLKPKAIELINNWYCNYEKRKEKTLPHCNPDTQR